MTGLFIFSCANFLLMVGLAVEVHSLRKEVKGLWTDVGISIRADQRKHLADLNQAARARRGGAR
jgi:hypothetical protein